MNNVKTVIIAWLAFGFLSVISPVRAQESLVLYVQEGCGHCAKVEKFIEDNELSGDIEIKDTILDPGVSEEYTEYLDSKEVPVEDRGVPLLVIDGNDHKIGDTPIISYLRDVFGIEEDTQPSVETGDTVLLLFGGGVVVSIFGYGVVNGIKSSKKK